MSPRQLCSWLPLATLHYPNAALPYLYRAASFFLFDGFCVDGGSSTGNLSGLEESLSGMEEVVLDGQAACKGLATSASIFRHTLSELDDALDVLRLREAWAGAQPANGVSKAWRLAESSLVLRVLTYQIWHTFS